MVDTMRLHRLTEVEKTAFIGAVTSMARLGLGAARGVGSLGMNIARNPVRSLNRGMFGAQLGAGFITPGRTNMAQAGMPQQTMRMMQ